MASFALVALVLGVGWLAYERKRPSARMAAVVAIMAALAALGRDAFVALPDVKPITAMTFVAGYALGPLPGFTVGALGMLASNFMLGQGPYTPWQMAAWGMVGLAGAALGLVSGRRLGRVPLALACAVSALAAKEIMNLYTWTLGATHTPAAFLAVSGQALAYDVTDTVASFLFGMAFAPELARLLGRVRSRMEVRWVHEPPDGVQTDATAAKAAAPGTLGTAGMLIAVAAVAAALIGGKAAGARGAETVGPARAWTAGGQSARVAVAARPAVSRELGFLVSAQNPDGGFGPARGQSSSELYSAWVAMGLAAAGRDPLRVRREGHTVLDALRGEASSLQGAGDLERTILALRACGAPVRSLPGGDPVRRLIGFRERDGSFGHLGNLTSFAIFALRAAGYQAGSQLVRSAADWLARQQNRDGGFGFATRGGPSDVDDTAAAAQALSDAAGPHQRAVSRSAAFLVRAQNLDGGYPQQPGGESNAQSTAWAIQGLTAAGRSAGSVTRGGSRSPLAYLESLVAPNGSVRYSRTGGQTPVWVTAQALTALAQRPFPIGPVRRAASHASAGARAAPASRETAQRATRAGATSHRPSPAASVRGLGLEGLVRALAALLSVVLLLGLG